MIFETYDEIEPVRPYLWYGEDQDAHVNDWREMSNAACASRRDELMFMASLRNGDMTSDMASFQHMSLSAQLYAGQLRQQSLQSPIWHRFLSGAVQGFGVR